MKSVEDHGQARTVQNFLPPDPKATPFEPLEPDDRTVSIQVKSIDHILASVGENKTVAPQGIFTEFLGNHPCQTVEGAAHIAGILIYEDPFPSCTHDHSPVRAPHHAKHQTGIIPSCRDPRKMCFAGRLTNTRCHDLRANRILAFLYVYDSKVFVFNFKFNLGILFQDFFTSVYPSSSLI